MWWIPITRIPHICVHGTGIRGDIMTRSGGHHGAIIPHGHGIGDGMGLAGTGHGVLPVVAGYILAGDTAGGMDGFIHVRTTPLPGHSHLMLPIAARRQELIATVRQGVLAVETARRQPAVSAPVLLIAMVLTR